MAGTDVAIDRATVIAGDEEAKATGRSRATTVGLNQAICWLSIYGTAIVAAVAGGYVAEHVPFKGLLVALAGVPALVLLFVLRLPKDTAVAIPLRRSIGQFWVGPELGLRPRHHAVLLPVSFPAAARPDLHQLHARRRCTSPRTQIGFADGAGQRRLLRRRACCSCGRACAGRSASGCASCSAIYIVVGAVVSLTQFALLEPWFSAITGALSRGLPFVSAGTRAPRISLPQHARSSRRGDAADLA